MWLLWEKGGEGWLAVARRKRVPTIKRWKTQIPTK